MSINREMVKDVVYTDTHAHPPHTHTHTNNGILLVHEKEWNNAICSNINRPRDYHTKWTQWDRER